MPKLVAYTLRHSFAVWKLTEGIEVALVAALMGHVDGRMVETRYGHIQSNKTLMMPNQWQLSIDVISDKRFQDYCLFGLHTGARPQEIGRMETRHYERENSRIMFPKDESKGKKRPRFIYLDDTAKEIVEHNLRPDGPILLN